MRKRVLLLILTVIISLDVFAQSRTITGIVKAVEKGETIIGATVRVKDTSIGTVSDLSGKFKITVPKGRNSLVVSSTGYATTTINLDTARDIVVSMNDDNKSLDEVVVVGYGTVKRKDLTGSVSSISAKDIADMPLNSASDVLTGRLAGVNIVSTDGQPGADATVKVRGGGSITQDNAPIYIVDGIQIENALQILSPAEIESVDVLKDAASTAIYGARGANGVIVITTKGGKAMKTRVSVDMYTGVRKIANELDVMDPYDFVKYQYQVAYYGSDSTKINAYNAKYGRYSDIDIYKNMEKVNWQDKTFGRSAHTFTQNANMTGGDKKTSFSLNLTNSNEQGVMIYSGFRRTMASLKMDHKLSDKVKVGGSVRYSQQRIQGTGTTNTGTQSNNRLRNAVRYQPYMGAGADVDVFDADYASNSNLTAPTLLASQETMYQYRSDALLNGYVNINLSKNLIFRSTVGFAPINTKTNQFSGPVTSVGRQNAGMPVVNITRADGMTLNNSNTISYNKSLKDLRFDLLLGEETYETSLTTQSSTTKWLPVDITADEAFVGIQRATPPAGLVQDAPSVVQASPNRLLSFFGRANGTYKDKILATFTMRRDGSSRFADGHQWGTFPAVALAYRISNEKFWKNLDPQKSSDVKVRLSMGSVGNNRIAGDLYHSVFGVNTSSYGYGEAITPGIAALSLSSPNLTWETTISRNAGLDLSLFNNRVSLTADFYLNSTHNLLLQANVPSTTGYITQLQNVGATRNKGMEFQLNMTPIRSSSFNWTSSFNISFNKNTVVDLGLDPSGQKVQSIYGYSGWVTAGTPDFLVQVGQPLGQFYGYVNDGYYTLDDFYYNPSTAKYTLKENVPNNRTALGNRDPQPGDMKFKKLSKDGSMLITDKDETVIGNAQPKFTGGWNNQFSYKGFDMSVFVYFSVGNKVYNANRIEYTTQYQYPNNNMLSIMNDRWKWYDDNGNKVTDPAALAALNKDTRYWTPSLGQYTPQSFAIEDGSFLRLSNVTLGYTFSDKWLKKTRILSRFRVYATVNNLYTLTKYSGFDPEANTRRSTPLTPGVDYSAYPRSRFYLAGVNIAFQ